MENAAHGGPFPGAESERDFGSDNHAGVLPEVLEALSRVNQGHRHAYGATEGPYADPHTQAGVAAVARHLPPGASIYFVYNGTAANVLGLSTLLERWQAVISTDIAHIHEHECGAPEAVLGCKLLTVPHVEGKLTPEGVRGALARVERGSEHYVQPAVVSITQATELGTVYTVAEIRALAQCAHDHGLALHLDGARLANAAAALDAPLRQMLLGVDVLTIGATKNGGLFGEAVAILDPTRTRTRAGDFLYQRKQAMQLHSKSRFLGAQFEALFGGDLWLRAARHANAMAARLGAGAAKLSGVELVAPVQANAVFARIPPHALPRLRARVYFHPWDETAGVCRWMCSFDTTAADVDHLLAELADILANPPAPTA